MSTNAVSTNAELLARLRSQRESLAQDEPLAPAAIETRWRWLEQEEGMAALGENPFGGVSVNSGFGDVHGLQADVSAMWLDQLTNKPGPPSPAVGGIARVQLLSSSIWEKDADGEILRDEKGAPKTKPQTIHACDRLRVASVLLEEKSGWVFALGFTGKTGPGAYVSASREEEVQEEESKDWAAMKGQFSRDGKDGVRPFPFGERFRMGRLGRSLAPATTHAGDGEALAVLGALCDEMSASFNEFSAKCEAASLRRHARMETPGKKRAVSRI